MEKRALEAGGQETGALVNGSWHIRCIGAAGAIAMRIR